jgi:serine protease
MIPGRLCCAIVTGILAATLLGSEAVPAQAEGRVSRTPQLIIKFRDDGERAALAPRERVALLAVETGVPMVHQRSMAFGWEVVSLFRALPFGEAEATAAELTLHSDVALAEPDYLRSLQQVPHTAMSPPAPRLAQKLTPNELLLHFQTYLDDSPGGIDAFAAWDITTGSASTVVAVVDTGITHHVDLAGRTVPGYCFVSNPLIANNDDCRGPDPYDPGNWVTADDLANPALAALVTQYNLTCRILPSEWHGTAVAGIIAATGNNGLFLAGLNWQARILSVRAYGKCLDGFDSDALDALAWAAGLSVPGAPDNANPAQVINLSAIADLTTACNPLWQDAVNQIFAHGVTRAFVAGAGNSSANVAGATPASCTGVIAVAATNRSGGLASYSNFGAGVALSAPGGDPLDFEHGYDTYEALIAILWDNGTTVPVGDSWTGEYGTSVATPMVSGVISLMLAVAPNLTPAQIRSILTSTAKPFPAPPAYGIACTTATCGAGILDAHAAVLAAQAAAGQTNYPDLNQHGLTGSWYEPATSGQGLEVEVYPDLSPGTGFAQVSWFTFDTAAGGADHERWYTLSGAVTSGQPSAALTIYQNTGGNFNALPMTQAHAVGTATLSFATCTSGQLAYSFTDGTGRMGTLALTRLTQNVTCSTIMPFPTNTDFAHSGNWFDSATAGQGFTVDVNPDSGALFAAWYTYAPMGAAAGVAGQRWYTAQGTFTAGLRLIPVTLYETSGGIFNMPAPPAQTVAVGTGTLAFQSCTAATFTYQFTGGSSSGLSGTVALSRVGPVPPGCTS